jgi:predicted MFS family arabinose efflux permease
VVGALSGGVVLLILFAIVERRSAAQLVPLRLFRSRAVSVSGSALALNSAGFLSMFFLTAIFLQRVRGDSALDAGLHFLPMGIAAVIGAVLASQLAHRVGTRSVQLIGTLAAATGLLLLSRADVADSYSTHILPGFVLFGFSIVFVTVPAQINAVSDVRPAEAGATSGVVNAMSQVGAALGLAVVTTLSVAHTNHQLAHGVADLEALQSGYHRGLLVGAAFALANTVLTLAAPQLRPNSTPTGQTSETAAAA